MFTKYDQESKQYSVKMNNSVIMKDDSDVTTGTGKHTLYKLTWNKSSSGIFLITSCPFVNYQYFFYFFSRTTGPNLTKLSTEHSYGKGNLNKLEGRYPFKKGIIAKSKNRVGACFKKIFFSRTHAPEIQKHVLILLKLVNIVNILNC